MNCVDRIKEVLKDRKISVHKLEVDCGFANGYISQLKKGTIPADRLAVIADYLGLSVNYLLTGTDTTMPEFEPEHVALIRMYAKLTAQEKEAVLVLMRSLTAGR